MSNTIKFTFAFWLSVYLQPIYAQGQDEPLVTEQALSEVKSELVPTYIFHGAGMSEGRLPYEKALLLLLMETSQERFGLAILEFENTPMTDTRSLREIGKGEVLQVQSAAIKDREADEQYAIILPVPILKNMLGYRQIIIRRDRLEEFRSINSWQQLSGFVVGQGTQWPDTKIIRSNGITVTGADSYKSLFPMLAHNRFDYLSLGAGEIIGAVSAQKKHENELTVVDNIVLYYPFPIYYFVSKTHPELAERLEYAFDLIIYNGEFDKLFNKHFSDTISRLNTSDTKVFVLNNPDYPTGHPSSDPLLLDKATIITRDL